MRAGEGRSPHWAVGMEARAYRLRFLRPESPFRCFRTELLTRSNNFRILAVVLQTPNFF